MANMITSVKTFLLQHFYSTILKSVKFRGSCSQYQTLSRMSSKDEDLYFHLSGGVSWKNAQCFWL